MIAALSDAKARASSFLDSSILRQHTPLPEGHHRLFIYSYIYRSQFRVPTEHSIGYRRSFTLLSSPPRPFDTITQTVSSRSSTRRHNHSDNHLRHPRWHDVLPPHIPPPPPLTAPPLPLPSPPYHPPHPDLRPQPTLHILFLPPHRPLRQQLRMAGWKMFLVCRYIFQYERE